MGKPGTELPDSLDPAPPASVEKVDDLLAQMAGEEIDRLLSESDDLRESQSTSHAAPTSASEPAIGRQLDALFSGSDDAEEQPGNGHVIRREEKPATVAAPTADAPPAQGPGAAANIALSDDEVSQQLTDLFNDEDPKAATEAPADTAKGDEAEKAKPVAPVTAGAAISDGALPPEIEFHTESSAINPERAELLPPATQESAGDDLKFDLEPEDAAPQWQLLAILLKPLQWLSSPMESCPDRVRDLIGKIALLTLFNATAVLAYVFLFRRHH